MPAPHMMRDPAPTPAIGIPRSMRIHPQLTPATNGNLRYIHAEHDRRMYRMFNAITGGRPLKAHAVWNTNGRDDVQQFVDDGSISSYSNTKTYYADGAYRHQGQHIGISSSAVVWREIHSYGSLIWQEETKTHERDTGLSDDAELYAIMMAIKQARKHICVTEYLGIDNIVVFTDCQKMVKMLAGEKNVPKTLGPVPLEEKWALEQIYEDAAALHKFKVSLVIAWTKGHSSGNEGNRRADRAASKAIFDVLEGGERIGRVPVEKHNWDDVKEEYLYRRSRPWFERGQGICFVDPEMSGHAGEEEEEVEVIRLAKETYWGFWRDVYKNSPRKVDYGKMYAQRLRPYQAPDGGNAGGQDS